MAISINSCLQSSPPPNPSSLTQSLPSKATQLPRSWRSRCFTGVACVIIGGSSVVLPEGESRIFAEELQISVENEAQGKVMKWSDQRKCPQWHPNSLESIVPENLPRPSARRRYEAVGIDQNAPAVGLLPTRRISGCFYL